MSERLPIGTRVRLSPLGVSYHTSRQETKRVHAIARDKWVFRRGVVARVPRIGTACVVKWDDLKTPSTHYRKHIMLDTDAQADGRSRVESTRVGHENVSNRFSTGQILAMAASKS